MVLCVCLVHRL